MAKIAFDIGTQQDSDNKPYQDGLIFFNTTNNTLTLDSDGVRTAYGTGLYATETQSTSPSLTYTGNYVSNNFVYQERVMNQHTFDNLLGDYSTITQPLCTLLHNISSSTVVLSSTYTETRSRQYHDAVRYAYITQRIYIISNVSDCHHVLCVWGQDTIDTNHNPYRKVWVTIEDISMDTLFLNNGYNVTNGLSLANNTLTITRNAENDAQHYSSGVDVNEDTNYPNPIELVGAYGLK